MNIPESNHIAADLGIPYMDTTQNYFQPKPQQRLDFQVRPNENLGLVLNPYQDIPILTPAEFLAALAQQK
jgi:hypothetical protein